MRKVNVLLLFSLSLLLVPGSGKAVRKYFYAGLNLGMQSLHYESKITDVTNNQNHKIDASRVVPAAGIFTGWQARLPSKFAYGLELGASFFPSEIKKSVNSGALNYKIKNKFTSVEAALLIGRFLGRLNAFMYLKLGAEYRTITVQVTSTGTQAKISKGENAFGFFPAFGLEIPLSSKLHLGAEGKFTFYSQKRYNDEQSSGRLTANISPQFQSFNLRLVYPFGNLRG